MSVRTVCLAASLAALTMRAGAAEVVGEDVIIVTASPLGRTVEETIIGTSVISGEDLERQLENSIGETLRREPGVSSTFFGAGASRPVIRGLGGDRISVLDAGIGSIDASATSNDHAVGVEPVTAERIEIVRGPATLLYGSSAAGGVVNVFSGRIPRALPDDGVDGAVRIGKTTVDDGVEAAGGFDAKLFDAGAGALVFHGDGYYREADDFKIPGFLKSQRLREAEAAAGTGDPEPVFGVAPNSSYSKKGGAAGLSYVFGKGFFGVSASAIDTLYGIPVREGEGGVSIDLRQRRLDLDGEIEGDLLLFSKAKIRVGYADYEHRELEPSGEVGTTFANEGVEGRFELIDKTAKLLGGDLNGAVGVQYKHRQYAAVGDEAFVPATSSDQYGVFALQELSAGPLRFEIGARFEATSHVVETSGFERTFNAVSASVGVGVQPSDLVFLGVSAFRTERAPSIEELFSDGPHLATSTFEVGDPALGVEVGRGVEATFRLGGDRIAFTLNGFYTSYKDFIYEAETGLVEDDLPVFQYVAGDATFKGFEAEVEAELAEVGGFDIHADASVDVVRASVAAAGGEENLPRIPPLSALLGLEARSALFDLRAEVEHAAGQDRTAAFELPTDSYTLYNAALTLRPFPQVSGLALRLSANNLSNEEARAHTSFLKDLVPMPGRNVRIALTGSF